MNALTKEVFSAVYNNTRVPDASYLQKFDLFNVGNQICCSSLSSLLKKMRRTGTLH
jgi:hypothetical protein